MHNYDTVSEAVNDLVKRGYTHNFQVCEEGIECSILALILSPDDVEIKEVYRFEGNTDPADEAVVYAIASKDGVKGVLVNGYGVSSDAFTDKIISKLEIASKKIQSKKN